MSLPLLDLALTINWDMLFWLCFFTWTMGGALLIALMVIAE